MDRGGRERKRRGMGNGGGGVEGGRDRWMEEGERGRDRKRGE